MESRDSVMPTPSEDLGLRTIKEARSELKVPGSVVDKTAPWFTKANNQSLVILNQQKPSVHIAAYSMTGSRPQTLTHIQNESGEEDE